MKTTIAFIAAILLATSAQAQCPDTTITFTDIKYKTVLYVSAYCNGDQFSEMNAAIALSTTDRTDTGDYITVVLPLTSIPMIIESIGNVYEKYTSVYNDQLKVKLLQLSLSYPCLQEYFINYLSRNNEYIDGRIQERKEKISRLRKQIGSRTSE